ncbi:hypothetical protein ABK040_011743 [Willaertia magna]
MREINNNSNTMEELNGEVVFSKEEEFESLIYTIKNHPYHEHLKSLYIPNYLNKHQLIKKQKILDDFVEDLLNDIEITKQKTQYSKLLNKLRRLCISDKGCLNKKIRKECWTILLHEYLMDNKFYCLQNVDINHSQYDQVEKDVDRSMYKFLEETSEPSNELLTIKRKELSEIVNSVLLLKKDINDVGLYYFQGYHEICSVFLLAFEDDLESAFRCSYRIAMNHFYDAMNSLNLDVMLKNCSYIHYVIEKADPEIAEILVTSGMTQGHYALSWILTWFSHVIDDINLVSRLFDLFIAVSNPLFSVYLSASVVIERREELIDLKNGKRNSVDGDEFAYLDDDNLLDFTIVFGLLNRFPKNITEEWLERVIERALRLWRANDYRVLLEEKDEVYVEKFPFEYMKSIEVFPKETISTTVVPVEFWRDEEEERRRREANAAGWKARLFYVGGSLLVAGLSVAMVYYRQMLYSYR